MSSLKAPLVLIAALGWLAPAASAQTTGPSARSLPADWYPESLAMGPDGSIYVGSWRQGAIARLAPGDDAARVFIPPATNGLANVQGLMVDAGSGILWACSGAIGFTTVPTTPSALKSFDLATGAARGSYAMPDKGHCNDLAQDAHGDIYVTDSFHPRILRLRVGASSLAIWKEDEALGSGATDLFLNGIAIDGTSIYVSPVLASAYILRVSIDPNGRAGGVTRVTGPRTLRNVDALRVYAPGRLALFESNAFGNDGPYGGMVTTAVVDGDRLTTLRTLVAGLNDPSSGIVAKGRLYFIESKYRLLKSHPHDDGAIPRNVPFDVQSIPFDDPAR